MCFDGIMFNTIIKLCYLGIIQYQCSIIVLALTWIFGHLPVQILLSFPCMLTKYMIRNSSLKQSLTKGNYFGFHFGQSNHSMELWLSCYMTICNHDNIASLDVHTHRVIGVFITLQKNSKSTYRKVFILRGFLRETMIPLYFISTK